MSIRHNKAGFLTSVAAAALLALAGCDGGQQEDAAVEEAPAEETVMEEAEGAMEQAEEAMEEAEGAMEDMGHEMEDAAHDMMDAAEDAAEEAAGDDDGE